MLYAPIALFILVILITNHERKKEQTVRPEAILFPVLRELEAYRTYSLQTRVGFTKKYRITKDQFDTVLLRLRIPAPIGGKCRVPLLEQVDTKLLERYVDVERGICIEYNPAAAGNTAGPLPNPPPFDRHTYMAYDLNAQVLTVTAYAP